MRPQMTTEEYQASLNQHERERPGLVILRFVLIVVALLPPLLIYILKVIERKQTSEPK